MNDAARRQRRRPGVAGARNAGPCWALALLVVTALGCGSAGSGTSQPTPTPALTPAPVPTPGCGNGIVDDGEFCDGESFCSNCTFAVTACCQFFSPAGETVCVEDDLAGAQACISTTPGGNWSVGTTCAGDPCDELVSICHRSPCEGQTIAPVSVCCQRTGNRCQDSVVANTADLAQFVVFDCNNTDEGTAVIGTCGDDGRCAPRR